MNLSIINDLLKNIYPNDLDFLKLEIGRMINRYQKIIVADKVKLTHEDSILITYADAIYQDDENSLTTLKRFFDEYLSGVVSAIHLLPCFPFTSDDGFSVVDYYEINPDYGDWNSIESLNGSADLMFDAVVNHTSKSSPWFKNFQNNIPPYNEYFIQADPKEDYSKVVRPRALPLLHPYIKEGKEVFLWTTFSEDQLDLNFRSPDVFLEVLNILLFYISKGGRYIRLDAIAFIWKEKNTTCIHLPEAHSIIQAYRNIIESIAPHAVIITETNVPHNENISYFGDGTNEAHMVYNFTLPPLLAYSIHRQDISVFVDWANTIQPENNTTCFFNFTASHDGIGVRPLQGIIPDEEIAFLARKSIEHGGLVSYKSNEDGSKSPYELNCNYFELLSHPSEPMDIRIKKFIITQAIMLTMPGVPGIYYHSILGSLNFKKGVEESGINRRINREKLEYNSLKKSIKQNNSLRAKVYHSYRKLLEIRSAQPVFNPYGKAKFYKKENTLIIERTFDDEKLLAVFNLTDKPVSLHFSSENFFDLIADTVIKGPVLEIAPWCYKWLKPVI